MYLCVRCYCDACLRLARCVWEQRRYTIQYINDVILTIFSKYSQISTSTKKIDQTFFVPSVFPEKMDWIPGSF